VEALEPDVPPDVAAGHVLPAALPISEGRSLFIRWDRTGAGSPEIEGSHGELAPIEAGSTTCLAAWGRPLDRDGLAGSATSPAAISRVAWLGRRFRQVGFRLAEEIGGSLCAVFWDGERRRLVVLRDRMGLGGGVCWADRGGRILLARRASRLARGSGRPVRPDTTSCVLHLHGHGPLPARTFYQGVSQVPPGCWLVASRSGVEVRSYWSVDPGRESAAPREAAEELRQLLRQVGRDWGEPDRPAMVSLSGGLDSPSIAAAICRSGGCEGVFAVHHTSPLLETGGESELARRTAAHLGLELLSIDGMRWWPLREAAGPLVGAESPHRVTYSELWSESFRVAAEKGAVVAFTGAGGDHLFTGPRAYSYPDLLCTGRWGELARRWRRHPPPRPSARQIVSAAMHASLPPSVVASRYRVSWLARRRRAEWAAGFTELQPSRRSPSHRELTLALRDSLIPVTVSVLADLAGPHGIEVRHPFFDHRLVELAARLSPDLAAADGLRKRVLREAVRPWLPRPLVERREKIFPDDVLERGLRERETRRVWSLLTDMRAADAGLVDEERLRRGYRDYLEGRGDLRLWHALTLESWLRHWF